MNRHFAFILFAAGAVVWGSASQAAIVGTVTTFSQANYATAAADDDLLQTQLASSTLTGYSANGAAFGGLAVLTDGTGGLNNLPANSGDAMVETTAGASDGWTADFELDVTTNTLGYDITSIISTSGWNNPAIAEQNFNLSVSVVGSSDFVLLGNFTGTATTGGGIQVTIADDVSGALVATGVDAIRFESTGGLRGGYRELDVIGTPTVPEPGSLGLIGLGSIMMLKRRRA
ncbi:MAG: PEP-CTERM sorting domain-containing protein [Planctomycetota bacterium]